MSVAGGVVVFALKIQNLAARNRVESFFRAGDGAAQRLARPERGVEQFLHVLLRLVHVHGQFLLDHFPFLGDFRRIKSGMKKHVRQHVQQFVETVVARPGIKAGVLLAREGVEIAANAFHRLGNLPRRAPPRALEQQMLDEMGNAAHLFLLAPPAHSPPKSPGSRWPCAASPPWPPSNHSPAV